MDNKDVVTVNSVTVAQRFVNKMLSTLEGSMSDITLTENMKRKMRGYYIAMDSVLTAAEAKRVKDGKGDQLPCVWKNVMLDNELAQQLYIFAQMGYDMSFSNMLFPIPRMNGKTKKYQFTFQEGFQGRIYKAMKYGLGQILNITVELIYSKDKFTVHKKDMTHPCDTFEFEMQPFDRGDIVGGFGYVEYADNRLNKLVILSKKDIDKRKAAAQSGVFWSKWYEEMALKTVAIKTCKTIDLDPDKLDAVYTKSLDILDKSDEVEMRTVVAENANGPAIDTTIAPEKIAAPDPPDDEPIPGFEESVAVEAPSETAMPEKAF